MWAKFRQEASVLQGDFGLVYIFWEEQGGRSVPCDRKERKKKQQQQLVLEAREEVA